MILSDNWERGMSLEKHAVTVFLQSKGEVLILLRSEHVRSYQGRWGGICGSIDEGKTADVQALIEIEEETGLSRHQVELVIKGEPVLIASEHHCLSKVVHPYLFHIEHRDQIRTNWEHKEVKWIRPEDMDKYQTIPKLKETLARVLQITG